MPVSSDTTTMNVPLHEHPLNGFSWRVCVVPGTTINSTLTRACLNRVETVAERHAVNPYDIIIFSGNGPDPSTRNHHDHVTEAHRMHTHFQQILASVEQPNVEPLILLDETASSTAGNAVHSARLLRTAFNTNPDLIAPPRAPLSVTHACSWSNSIRQHALFSYVYTGKWVPHGGGNTIQPAPAPPLTITPLVGFGEGHGEAWKPGIVGLRWMKTHIRLAESE